MSLSFSPSKIFYSNIKVMVRLDVYPIPILASSHNTLERMVVCPAEYLSGSGNGDMGNFLSAFSVLIITNDFLFPV